MSGNLTQSGEGRGTLQTRRECGRRWGMTGEPQVVHRGAGVWARGPFGGHFVSVVGLAFFTVILTHRALGSTSSHDSNTSART